MSNHDLNLLLQRLYKLHPKYIDLSLNRLLKLLSKLKNPHLNLPPVIHIAGTNGKGSTLSFIRQILIEHDYLTHCYVSPHLENIQERFIVSNKKITKKKLYKTLKDIEIINDNDPITFFEITTAAAFFLFNKSKADFLILETGLGGEFDATNVIKNSLLDIITPISFDHKEYLGTKLINIIRAKLGIIKKNSSIIIGKQKKETLEIILRRIAKYNNNKVIYNKDFKILKTNNNSFYLKLNKNKLLFNKPSLLGDHQIENSAIAVASCYELKKYGYKIKKKFINKGLATTIWPGRLEKIIVNKIPCYLDGAHNTEGAYQLSNFLNKNCKNTWIIFGMLNNKDIYSFLKILNKNIAGVIAIKIPSEKNAFKANEIYRVCKKLKIFCIPKKNISFAKKYLVNNVKPDNIVVTGSLYLIGKAKKFLT